MQRSLLLLVLILVTQDGVFAAESRFQRWAVIATDEVVKSGLPDLLTVGMSSHESLQVVERERLAGVMQELELSTILEADRVDRRLELGRILKTNALLVLSFDRSKGTHLLKVVVCDSDLGVRLWDGCFDFRDGKIESLVQHCMATIEEVRQRFAGGIHHIVAVPAFLSENFEHRFDGLQTRYRDLLTGSLTTRAGVAVVEIDEARAVLRELQSTFSAGLDRPITSVVKAAYQVDSRDDQTVMLKIELSDGGNRPERLKKTLTFDSVGHWLATELTEKVLADTETRRAKLVPAAQKEILTRHAGRFAALGNWNQSIPLREAVLVIDPDDALQRALLISEYQYRFLPEVKSNWHPAVSARPASRGARESTLRLAVHDYKAGLDHLTWMIRNRLINRFDAIGLLGKHVWYLPPYQIAAVPSVDGLKREVMQSACEAQRRFLREVYPLVKELPKGRRLPRYLSEPFYGAQYVLTCHVVSDVGFNGFASESLESLRELLTRHLPGDARTGSSLLGLLGYTHSPRRDDACYEDWIGLCRELSQSDRELARIYGRYALALEQRKTLRSNAALEQLLSDVVQMGRTDEPVYNVINLRLGRPKAQSVRKPVASMPQGDLGPLGRLKLQPLPLTVDESDPGDASPHFIGMRRCGKVDAYWTRSRFFVMQRRNVLRELKLTNHAADHRLFQEVAWDGEYIWLQASGRGIVAVRPDGTDLTSFRGMTPSYSTGHRLMGLSPGRALMVGSFGEKHRAWCGLLKVEDGGQRSVNVFFEAKNVAEGRHPSDVTADPTTVFQPDELSLVTAADSREFALVERRGLSPMLIDLKSLEVSVPEKPAGLDQLSTQTRSGFFGRLFLRQGIPVRVNSGVATSRNSKRILYHDGWLYRPGYIWVRQHVTTGKLERLQARTLPHEYWDLRAGSSAFYGLITYSPFNSNQPVSRIMIADDR